MFQWGKDDDVKPLIHMSRVRGIAKNLDVVLLGIIQEIHRVMGVVAINEKKPKPPNNTVCPTLLRMCSATIKYVILVPVGRECLALVNDKWWDRFPISAYCHHDSDVFAISILLLMLDFLLRRPNDALALSCTGLKSRFISCPKRVLLDTILIDGMLK